MKKMILIATTLAAFASISNATELPKGPIEIKFDKIDHAMMTQKSRIEGKLDLLLSFIIEEERAEIRRKIVIDSTIDKTKEKIGSGLTWIKSKLNQ
jgi:hypothetical protein